MYKCAYCGFVPQNENLDYCKNPNCQNYCKKQDGNEDFYKNHFTYKINADPPAAYVSAEHKLGFATVPFQKYNGIYPLNTALSAGTVFEELDMPYNKKIFRRG